MKFFFKVYYFTTMSNFFETEGDRYKIIKAKNKEEAKKKFSEKFPDLHIIEIV